MRAALNAHRVRKKALENGDGDCSNYFKNLIKESLELASVELKLLKGDVFNEN